MSQSASRREIRRAFGPRAVALIDAHAREIHALKDNLTTLLLDYAELKQELAKLNVDARLRHLERGGVIRRFWREFLGVQ